jgi:adenosylcobinamide-GDP ribazoletransferase
MPSSLRVDSLRALGEKTKSMKNITAAFSYLTFCRRFTNSHPPPAVLGTAACYFPVIGLLLGMMLVGINHALRNHLDPEILSIVLATALTIATGAIHIEGLQKTLDSRAGRSEGAANTDSSSAVGIVAILLVLLFKIKSIEILHDNLVFGLLLMPVFARWALVVFIYGSYRFSEGEAREIAQQLSFSGLLLTSIATLTLATYLLGPTALWIGVYLSVFALICRTIFQKRNGALTTNHLGAVVELSETLCLIALAWF